MTPSLPTDLPPSATVPRSLWKWQLTFWVPFFALELLLFAFYFNSWRDRLFVTLSLVLLLAAMTTGIELVHRRLGSPFKDTRANFTRTVLFSILFCLPAACIELNVTPLLYRLIHLDSTDPVLFDYLCTKRSNVIISFCFWFGTCFVWCLARFFFLEWAERLREERKVARNLIAAQHRELSLLRSQLNVHFLFNALNSLITYAEYDPKVLQTLVHAMADYLRFCLESRDEKAPLQKEIDAIGNYLKIEHLRHLDALVYEIDCTPEAARASAPIPILQPLIENALRYGIKTAPRPLRLRVTAHIEDGHLHAEVANTGKWISEGKSDSTGVGLANLRRKLDLLYPNRARLFHESGNEDGWVRARIILPVE